MTVAVSLSLVQFCPFSLGKHHTSLIVQSLPSVSAYSFVHCCSFRQAERLESLTYLLVESTGLLEPLPGAEPRRGRRTILTFPLLPPPQKN